MKKYGFKILSLLLAIIFILSAFVGCSKNKNADETSSQTSSVKADVPVEEVTDEKTNEKQEETKQEQKSEDPIKEEPKPEPVYVAVEKITLDKYSITVVEGATDMPRVTMHPTNCTNKAEIWSSDNTAVATVNGIGKITGVSAGNCTVTVRSVDNPNAFATVEVTVNAYVPPAEPEVTYINGILIANKTYSLPANYNPGVNSTANAALQEMFAAAKLEGLNLFVKSGFRSYSTQKTLYNNYVSRDGVAAADRYSARPGHSEHQTGLAFDINKADSSFTGSPEANWLALNCYKFGFIIRYPAGKESITGYMYEPWHIRYLGVETATAVYNSGLCLEEYLGITSVYQ